MTEPIDPLTEFLQASGLIPPPQPLPPQLSPIPAPVATQPVQVPRPPEQITPQQISQPTYIHHEGIPSPSLAAGIEAARQSGLLLPPIPEPLPYWEGVASRALSVTALAKGIEFLAIGAGSLIGFTTPEQVQMARMEALSAEQQVLPEYKMIYEQYGVPGVIGYGIITSPLTMAIPIGVGARVGTEVITAGLARAGLKVAAKEVTIGTSLLGKYAIRGRPVEIAIGAGFGVLAAAEIAKSQTIPEAIGKAGVMVIALPGGIVGWKAGKPIYDIGVRTVKSIPSAEFKTLMKSESAELSLIRKRPVTQLQQMERPKVAGERSVETLDLGKALREQQIKEIERPMGTIDITPVKVKISDVEPVKSFTQFQKQKVFTAGDILGYEPSKIKPSETTAEYITRIKGLSGVKAKGMEKLVSPVSIWEYRETLETKQQAKLKHIQKTSLGLGIVVPGLRDIQIEREKVSPTLRGIQIERGKVSPTLRGIQIERGKAEAKEIAVLKPVQISKAKTITPQIQVALQKQITPQITEQIAIQKEDTREMLIVPSAEKVITEPKKTLEPKIPIMTFRIKKVPEPKKYKFGDTGKEVLKRGKESTPKRIYKKGKEKPWYPASLEMVTLEEIQTGKMARHIKEQKTTQKLAGRFFRTGRGIPTAAQFEKASKLKSKSFKAKVKL